VPDYGYYDRLSDLAFQLPLSAHGHSVRLLQHPLLAASPIVSCDSIFADEAFSLVIGFLSFGYSRMRGFQQSKDIFHLGQLSRILRFLPIFPLPEST